MVKNKGKRHKLFVKQIQICVTFLLTDLLKNIK